MAGLMAKTGKRQQQQSNEQRLDALRAYWGVPTAGPSAMAAQGQGTDTEVGHLTPGEVVVPPNVMQQPGAQAAVGQQFQRAGVPMGQYTVGNPQQRRNPRTGAPEFRPGDSDGGYGGGRGAGGFGAGPGGSGGPGGRGGRGGEGGPGGPPGGGMGPGGSDSGYGGGGAGSGVGGMSGDTAGGGGVGAPSGAGDPGGRGGEGGGLAGVLDTISNRLPTQAIQTVAANTMPARALRGILGLLGITVDPATGQASPTPGGGPVAGFWGGVADALGTTASPPPGMHDDSGRYIGGVPGSGDQGGGNGLMPGDGTDPTVPPEEEEMPVDPEGWSPGPGWTRGPGGFWIPPPPGYVPPA